MVCMVWNIVSSWWELTVSVTDNYFPTSEMFPRHKSSLLTRTKAPISPGKPAVWHQEIILSSSHLQWSLLWLSSYQWYHHHHIVSPSVAIVHMKPILSNITQYGNSSPTTMQLTLTQLWNILKSDNSPVSHDSSLLTIELLYSAPHEYHQTEGREIGFVTPNTSRILQIAASEQWGHGQIKWFNIG